MAHQHDNHTGHNHQHDHDHDHAGGLFHSHDHAPVIDHLNAAFIWGIILNTVFVLVEGGLGFFTGSLSLLTDAGHNLSDVASLALALMAFKLAKVNSNKRYTYGFKRSTIVVSFFNALILFVAVGFIVYEAVMRFLHPEPVPGSTIAWVALVGIGINGFTAWLFMRDKERDLNIKGAYLHMAVDAIVSLGVVISGLIIQFTGWFWVDTLVSLIVAVVIVGGTWGLLTKSLRLEMDGVPADMDLERIKEELLKNSAVVNVHHVHVWALSTTENALTAHLVIKDEDMPTFTSIKQDLRHRLEHLQISHATFEPELASERCGQVAC